MNLKLNLIYPIFTVVTYSWGEIPTTSLKQVKNGLYEVKPIFLASESKVFEFK